MSINITTLSIQDEFGNNVTDFARCNIGDKLTITTDIEIATSAVSSVSSPIILNYTGQGVVNSGGYWVYDPAGQFAEVKIGDVLERKNKFSNALIDATINVLDKLNNQTIKVDVDLAPGYNDEPTEQSIFNLKTAITALRMNYNFIGNNESTNYISKVDGSVQELLANALLSTYTQTSGSLIVGQKYYISDFNAGDDFTNVGGTNVTGAIFTATGTTPTTYSNGSTLNRAFDFEFQGAKPYQIGSATIVCMGNNTSIIYGQKFKIIHETFMTPFFLSDQWTDLFQGINPVYFQNNECLRYIFKISAMYNFTDPNRALTYESVNDVNLNFAGNTGGFNENFNTGLTNYSVFSKTYLNNLGNQIDEIELTTNETSFSIVIKNTTDSPFSNNNTKFTLNFIRAPYDSTEYVNNTKTLAENFCFDRAQNTIGAASVDGDNFGTDYQVLKDVVGTFNSSSQITISGKIAFDANVVSEISQADEYRYLFFISVQNHTKTNNDSDRVNLLADINTFFVDASDPTMISIENKFINHVQTDFNSPSDEIFDPHIEDEIVARSRFYIDSNGRTADDIVITSMIAKIKCFNTSTEQEFTLDQYSINMANVTPSGDITLPNFQQINLSIPRVFHIPTTEIRKNIVVQRRSDLDAGGKVYFDIVFPFMVRWEYWLALAGVNSDFFDINEPNDNFNNSWLHYANGSVANWVCRYEFIVNVKKNGTPLQFTASNDFSVTDYSTDGSIKTYDSNNVELTNGALKYVLGYEDTKIVATFPNLDSGFNINNCHVVIGIEVKEQGGVSGRRRLSSLNVQTTDTWLKSATGNGLVSKAATSSTEMTATCYIDKTLIPLNVSEFKVSARLYYPPFKLVYKTTEGYIFKNTEDGNFETIE